MPFAQTRGLADFLARRSNWIPMVVGGGLSLGLGSFLAWHATGDTRWLTLFFQWPWIAIMVGLAAVEVWLSISVRRAFLPDEPLHLAWSFIGASAVFDLAGGIGTQWLSSSSPLNPLLNSSWWSPNTARDVRHMGMVLGGTFRYALLSAGLLFVLRIYRKAGFPGRLKIVDWVLLGIVLSYVINQTIEVVVAIQHGKSPSVPEMLSWPVDPLLCVLLFETRLLARSIERMGKGSIGRCWSAFTTAILLVWIGDLGTWASAYGHLSWQWASLGWYVWLPAAGAFAAAPAYQLEAISQALNAHNARTGASLR